MKHGWLALILLLGISNTILAQQFKFGLTASPQFAFSHSNDQAIEQDGIRLGLEYGLLVDYTFDVNQRYAFHTGFIHALSGANIATSATDTAGNMLSTTNMALKYQYINIPLSMRLRTNEIGYLTYWGQFGVTPGILISGRYDQQVFDQQGNEISNIIDEKRNGAIPVNLSLTLGGGIEYSLGGASALMLGLQYNNGFTNVYNDKDNDDDDKLSFRNITLRVGFLF